jgi:hypothetical protein
MSIYAAAGRIPILVWCPSKDDAGNGTSTVFDLVGSANGTNGAAWVLDTTANGVRALSFASSQTTVGSIPAVFVNSATISMSYWFKRASTSVVSCLGGMGRTIGGTGSRFTIQPWSDGNVYVAIHGSNSGRFVSNDLNWHHILAVFDGTQSTNATRLKVYFDGAPVTLTFAGTIPTTVNIPQTVRLGQTFSASNEFGTGLIDDFRLYNDVLPEAAATYLYNSFGGRGRVLDGSYRYPTFRDAFCGYKASLDTGASATDQFTADGSQDGTLTSGATRVDDGGLAYSLANDTDEVNLGATAFSFLSTDAWTISLWVKINSVAGNCGIIGRNPSVGGAGWYLVYDVANIAGIGANVLRFDFITSTNSRAYIPATQDTWHHIIFGRSNSQNFIYLNNTAGTFGLTNTGSVNYTSTQARIGTFGGMYGLRGQFDDVLAWNRVLTSNERLTLNTVGRGAAYELALNFSNYRRRMMSQRIMGTI